MKHICFFILGISLLGFTAPKPKPKPKPYMSVLELRVIELLNQVRSDPKGFEKNVIRPLLEKDPTDEYLITLTADLLAINEKLPTLFPDSILTVSARCHAKEIGEKGLVTHTRQTKECKELQTYGGECVSFGPDKAESILLLLLIDHGIVGVGHRKICLSKGYSQIGVAMEPHTTYGICVVLDFD